MWSVLLRSSTRLPSVRAAAAAAAAAVSGWRSISGGVAGDKDLFQDCSYGHLSLAEVARAWFVLQMCSSDVVVRNGLHMLEKGERFLGRRLVEKLLRPTLYAQFVAGDDPESLQHAAAKLQRAGVRLMVLPSLEEDVSGVDAGANQSSQYDRNAELTLELARLTGECGGPLSCLQTKITALIPADLMLKVGRATSGAADVLPSAGGWANYLSGGKWAPAPYLNAAENAQLQQGLDRLKAIGQGAVDKELRLLIDGEYTYLNDAISMVAVAMAAAFNGRRPVVWNTYQCYLRGAPDKVRREMSAARRLGVCFGAKVVRGAYLERERQLHAAGADPTNPDYQATSATYDSVVELLIRQVASQPGGAGARLNLVVATHNERSILSALELMRRHRISPTDDTVVFAQIYGMAGYISTKLAATGMIVYNSVPYGSLMDVLPYLSRRAAENRSVLQGTRRERLLLSRQLRDRCLPFLAAK